MADIVIENSSFPGLHWKRTLNNFQVQTGPNTIYQFGCQGSTSLNVMDFGYWKSTNGGQTWGSFVEVMDGAATTLWSIWAERWTHGTGDLVHIAAMGSFGVEYRNLDTSDDSLSTMTEITTLTDFYSDNASGDRLWWGVSITETLSGNLVVLAGSFTTSGSYKTVRTTDHTGATGWADADAPSWFGFNKAFDSVMLSPSDADNDDVIAIIWDISANDIVRRNYDWSANSWSSPTTIDSDATEGSTGTFPVQFATSFRQSDSHTILVFFSQPDASTTDLRAYDVASGSITALTTIISNESEMGAPAVCINQQNDNIHVRHARDGTWNNSGNTQNVQGWVSDDDGSTWTSEGDSNDTSADIFQVVTTPSVDDAGGRILPVWTSFYGVQQNVTNYDNSIEIAAASGDNSSSSSSTVNESTSSQSSSSSSTINESTSSQSSSSSSSSSSSTINESTSSESSASSSSSSSSSSAGLTSSSSNSSSSSGESLVLDYIVRKWHHVRYRRNIGWSVAGDQINTTNDGNLADRNRRRISDVGEKL